MTGTFGGAAPRIGADRLPASAWPKDDPGAGFAKARVVLTVPDDTGAGRFLVWTTPDPRHPAVDLTYQRSTSRLSRARADWEITTIDGGVWIVRGERGCCSVLAHMPWPWSTYTMGPLGADQ